MSWNSDALDVLANVSKSTIQIIGEVQTVENIEGFNRSQGNWRRE